MNQKNLEHLARQLFGIGYQNMLDSQLKEGIQTGNKAFSVSTEFTYGNDKIAEKVNISRGKESDLYYINHTDRTFKPRNDPERSIHHRFQFIPRKYEKIGEQYVAGPNLTITRKEAYNLFRERDVLKNVSDDRKEWVSGKIIKAADKDNPNNKPLELLQLKNYPEFNHRELLGKYPITDLASQKLADIFFDSLERGNLQKTAFLVNGEKTDIYVAVTARYKSADFYDSSFNFLYKEDLQKILGPDVELSPQRSRLYTTAASGEEKVQPVPAENQLTKINAVSERDAAPVIAVNSVAATQNSEAQKSAQQSNSTVNELPFEKRQQRKGRSV